MKLQLLINKEQPSCQETERIWQALCAKYDHTLETIEILTNEGQALSAQLELKSLPALIVDKKIVAVGNPDEATARRIFEVLMMESPPA